MTRTSRARAHTEMMYELEQMQDDMFANWLDKSMPDDWTGLDSFEPIERHKTRITLRVDSDTVRWFRKLGPGYQTRMNRVLRIYWTALQAGHIQAYPNEDVLPRLAAEVRRSAEAVRAMK